MSYVVCSTEQNNAAGNDMETKARLQLMCFDEDTDDIAAFAVDFFNDVTGLNHTGTRLYDVQSKKATSTPKEIGKELVTLYKNHVSDFSQYFVRKILFLGGVLSTVLNDPLSQFTYSDLSDSGKAKVRDGLFEECCRRSYIQDEDVTDENIDTFLDEVIFVVAEDNAEDCIRPLMHVSPKIIPTDNDLLAIFNEIKKKQVGIKASRKVRGCGQKVGPDWVQLFVRIPVPT